MEYLEMTEVGDLDIGVGNSYVLKDEDGAVCVVRVTMICDNKAAIVRHEPSIHFEYIVGMVHRGSFDDMAGSGVLEATPFAQQVVREF